MNRFDYMSETMSAECPNLSLEAGRQALCLKWANKKVCDVVKWADERILESDEISEALFQLSMAKNLAECRDFLAQIAQGADEWEVLKLFFSDRHKCLTFDEASELSARINFEYSNRSDCPQELLKVTTLYEPIFNMIEAEPDWTSTEGKEFLRRSFNEDIRRFSTGAVIETDEFNLRNGIGWMGPKPGFTFTL